MATLAESPRRSPFAVDPHSYSATTPKSLPILSAAVTLPSITVVDQMDISQPQSGAMGPPLQHSPMANGERAQEQHTSTPNEHHFTNGNNIHPVGAAAAAQQPKVVQTAFIHKLYNMLEDPSIQHLISWSNTNESFVMSPSSEFSKVLAQYFKHTNVSSFVRQLNMYGFHKVSDVFHTGSPDAPLWEFKHGAGNFKRGDLVGLREIKRRASRHALIHRDSFSGPTPKIPLPPPPGPPLEAMQDPLENRLSLIEWTSHDLMTRFSRTEEAYNTMAATCQALLDGLSRCHQWNQELSSHILTLVPDPENPVHRDVFAMRQDIQRRVESLRSLESPDGSFGLKQSFFSKGSGVPNDAGMSPRQRPCDDSRRPSLQGINSLGRSNTIRAIVPQHLQMSPRRYGSIGGLGSYSPTSSRNTAPSLPPPLAPAQPQQTQPSSQQPHPLSNMSSPPGLPRRHTSADIRLGGWQGGQPPPNYTQKSSPYASGQSSAVWPSSPRAAAAASGDQQLQDALAQYELPRVAHNGPHQPSPPTSHENGVPPFANSFGSSYSNTDTGWQLPGPRYPFRGLETPGPPTRRSSMASNVHSLLNPAVTAEREDEDEDGPDERKRKRIQ